MSKKGNCHRCARQAWLDICRGCSDWFCDLCFTGKKRNEECQHEKLRAEDVAKLDAEVAREVDRMERERLKETK